MQKIILNRKGIDALLKSEEIRSFVYEQAQDIQGRCGSGYSTDSYMTPSRVVSSVFTENEAAVQDNLKNNTLLKAVHK